MRQRSNNQSQPIQLATYEVHPISIKMLNQGNPWVTLDKYSEKFKPFERFIVALDRQKPIALLLHDPTHKTIRARLWSKSGNFEKQIKDFRRDLTQRIDVAFRNRKSANLFDHRDNLYLIFGEADNIPGLFVTFLNGHLLIQSYTNFWDKYQDFLIKTITTKLLQVFNIDVFKTQIWMQKRVDGDDVKLPPKCLDANLKFKDIEVQEFGVKYKVNLGQHYDVGIYTDMASVRFALKDVFSKAKTVLNLYSYTGAFSLFAFAQGAEEVVSVDLSRKYLDWLEENIALNESMDISKHTSLDMSAIKGMEKLKEQGKKFDLIICDPPTSSSNGKVRTNAIREYENMLPLINLSLTENGKAVVFLNTHKVSRIKFQTALQDILVKRKLPLKISTFHGLKDDCPSMAKFAEGAYLKGILLERTKNPPKATKSPEVKSENQDQHKAAGRKPPMKDRTTTKKSPARPFRKKTDGTKVRRSSNSND